MSESKEPSERGLPPEFINRLSYPLSRFLKIEAGAGVVLLFATVVAIIIANSPWSATFLSFWEIHVGFQLGPLTFTRSLRHWVNDGLMTIFFFVVALELKREMVLGELRSLRMAALPFAAALGGILMPALIFFALVKNQAEVHGWGIVMATDTAFVIGCLALFGSHIPSSLRLFLLSLAVFDDVGAILVVAFGYGEKLNWAALGLALLGVAIIAGTSRVGARSVPIYTLIGGVIWLCFDASGIHPTVAGVVLGLMTPSRSWISDARLRSIFGQVLSYPHGDHWSGDTADRRDLRQAGVAAREVLSPVERLELRLHPWVAFMIMPIFALANAGVTISLESFDQPLSWAIAVSLVCGKPIGVVVLSWLAVRLGFATLLPQLSWKLLAAGSLLTGIGFTMSLFIAGLALPTSLLAAAKLGILISSFVSAATGTLALAWLILNGGKISPTLTNPGD